MSGPRRVADLSAPGRALARLVPQIYLTRDATLPDRPLLRLLEVLATPLADLDRAIDDLLDDHFVERARADVLPLIAELVGARLLGTDPRTNRAVIASTVSWRRRKGSLSTLEEVLGATTGWAAEADESARSVLATQDLDDLLRHRGRTAELTDPVVLADPLSRRPAEAAAPILGSDGDLDGLLRELGAADALRPAVSPRTLDLDGWARPERVVVRTSRLAVREVDRQEIVHLRAVAHVADPPAGPSRFVGLSLDPRGEHHDSDGRSLPFPLAAVRVPGDPLPDVGPVLSEPDPAPPRAAAHGADLLTASALSLDAGRGTDVVTLFVDDVPVVGGPAAAEPPQPLTYQPPGALPVLRLADAGRPAPGERWELQVAAVDRPDVLGTGWADPAVPPATSPAADNPVVLQTVAEPGAVVAPQTTPAAVVPRSGARVGMRVRRLSGAGYRRDADAMWSVLDVVPRRGHPVSPVVTVADPGGVLLVRIEDPPGETLRLSRLRPDDPGADWDSVPLELPGLSAALLGDVGDPGPWLAAAGADDALLLAGPVQDDDRPAVLGLWRVAAPGPATGPLTGVRLDTAGGPAPSARTLTAACVAAGRFWLFGGQDVGTRAVLADLWSAPVAGPGGWTRHRTRHAPPRTGGRLVPLGGFFVLLGGASRPGALAEQVLVVDPGADRPVWTELPALPIETGRPGVLWARDDGPDLEVVAWPDRARPRTLRLTAGERAWVDAGPDAGDAPNPPAEGDAVFAGDQLMVPGPVPLPASEVVLGVGGRGVLAFLPGVDPADDAAEVFLLDADGSAERWIAPGTTAGAGLRLGAGRAAPPVRREAPGRRLGIPGRLGRAEFRLGQRSLGPWDRPLALDLDGVVALDPRLGRLLLPRVVVAGGRLSASYRTGRAEALGAGFAGAGRAVPGDWQEPPDPVDPQRWTPATAPELDGTLVGGPAAVTAQVLPGRAGEVLDGLPCVAGPGAAVRRDAPEIRPGVRAHVVAVPGSPRLEPDVITVAQGDVFSLFGAAGGAVPHLGAEDGVSLRLQERLAQGDDSAAGPSWFLTGLSTDGAVELLVGAGLLDLRWCDLAPPRRDDPAPRTGLRVAGVAAAGVPRWPLPEPGAGLDPAAVGAGSVGRPVSVRLVGCVVGRIEVPPWVQVIAAGCTFDAGADDAEAIAAAGAALRLRHCTVRGNVTAGRLEASSCLIRGRIDCDRPDRSWLRHCAVDTMGPAATGGPLRYRTADGPISLVSVAATDPRYLVPDDNNDLAVPGAGEHGLQPGAHGRRARGLAELTGRTTEFLPFGLVPHHLDRAAADLRRMNRRLP
ncbi:phage tail protein [Micromonospora sp. CB01531]|uniref:phage tail protein n=1 Tax=Micromonospora sp. CB01531 TaxID=1718947 RepID=UPI00093AE58C|nr:phage tail protein [Micromonospora sp. CB01531]OKI51399.1 hypothetical protein A6A27_33535 [Micromonospora sp. CB01531]